MGRESGKQPCPKAPAEEHHLSLGRVSAARSLYASLEGRPTERGLCREPSQGLQLLKEPGLLWRSLVFRPPCSHTLQSVAG